MLNVIGSVFPVACMLLTRGLKKTCINVSCIFFVCRPSKVDFDDWWLGFVRVQNAIGKGEGDSLCQAEDFSNFPCRPRL